jgi:hypothetical protein
MDMRHLGQVAYEAYAEDREWTSVHGEALLAWEDMNDGMQLAWEYAATEAVVAYLRLTVLEIGGGARA